MRQQFIFLGATLCIIATISLLKLHLIDSQYAAVALSDLRPNMPIATTPSVQNLSTSTPLFPLAKKATVPSKETSTPITHTVAIKASTPIHTAPIPTISFDTINQVARDAVVNIACTAPGADTPISGSGVLIDPRGVILTNAHVAQYVLLQDSGQISLSCVARTGSPARDTWHVEVIYISSEWIHAHATEIRQEHPVGTGENDYALLRITNSTNATPLPPSFPSLKTNADFEDIDKSQSVLVASYPAGFAQGIAAFSNLALISTVTTIKDIFTFSESHTPDLISLGGIIVAQSGSSGGAVVDQWMRVIGIVATASTAADTADRDLRAISLFHINQSMMKETNSGLTAYIQGDLNTIESSFKKGTGSDLIKTLVDGLMKK